MILDLYIYPHPVPPKNRRRSKHTSIRRSSSKTNRSCGTRDAYRSLGYIAMCRRMGMSSSKPKTSKGIGSAKKPKSFAPSHYCTNMPISMAASSSIGSRPLNSASCANRGENAYDAKPKRHIPKAISIAYSPPMPKRIRQHDATSPERRRCRPQCPKKRRRKAIFSGRQTRSFSSISIRPVDV